MKTIKEYSMEAIDQNNMTLSSISENLITIKADGNSEHTLRLNFGPLQFLNNDGFNAKEWVIPVTEVVVRKHHDANTVKVTKKLLARGSSNYDAKENLKKISTEVTQSGNIIYVPQGIILGPNERFRDQRLVLEFDVPISMQVEIDPNLQLRSYQVEEMDGIKTKF